MSAIRVTAAILVRDGAVLLARRPTSHHLAGHWELPGGKIELGEEPEECLARELAEECGIEAQVGQFFAESDYDYPDRTIQLLAYRVDSYNGVLEPLIHDELRWVAPDEIDALTLAPADIPILRRLCDELC